MLIRNKEMRHIYYFASSIIWILTPLLMLSACKVDNSSRRQQEVANRGAGVMPFDLDRTTHIFEKQEDGGLQQVLSDDQDATQIELIQSHLKEESERFSKGDFHDPAMIHGESMPGLHALVMGHEKVEIIYAALENGGQIHYIAQDTSMIRAIHQWFDAQLSDHGHHAQGHH